MNENNGGKEIKGGNKGEEKKRTGGEEECERKRIRERGG